jgi:hypothetical protein
MPLLDDFSAQSDRQVSFSHARRAEQQNRLAMRQKIPRGELPDQTLVHRGLQRELELIEGLQTREMGDLKPHSDPLVLLRVDLALQGSVQKLEVRPIPLGGLREHRRQRLSKMIQLQTF